jgi:hypothetical protein
VRELGEGSCVEVYFWGRRRKRKGISALLAAGTEASRDGRWLLTLLSSGFAPPPR